MDRRTPPRLLLGALALLVAGCETVGNLTKAPGQATTRTVTATGPAGEAVGPEPPSCAAPLARVGVYRFTDRTAKGKGGYAVGFQWYTPQIGDGMAEMLTDALLQSGCFRVVERGALEDVLVEQDLAAGGRVSRQTGAPVGQITGAQYLVKGAVTEFEPGAAGARAGLGLGRGWLGAIAGGVAGGLRASHVALVIQVVDATTSEIVGSTTVEGTANDFDVGGFLAGFGGGFAGVGGLGVWQKTPVEKAIRIAIVHATREIATRVGPSEEARAASSPPGATAAAPAGAPAPADPGELPSTVAVQFQAVSVRASPDPTSQVIAVVRNGARLPVMGRTGEWFAVTWQGRVGYVHASTVAAP